MPVSEAKKKANAKWDNENMATIACKMKKNQAERFKSYCIAQGKTSNAVLREYVLRCIGEAQDVPSVPDSLQEGGGVNLSPETMETAQQAAQSAGETLAQFIDRAVSAQSERDKSLLRMGINPSEKRNGQE